MLTADLVVARRHKGELRVAPLDERTRARAEEIAAAYLAIVMAHVGRPREELDEALAAVEVHPRERKLADGLRKLLDDRCDFDAGEGADPEALRREVFTRAAAARAALDDGAAFDRARVLAEAAAARGIDAASAGEALYADLRAAHRLRAVETITAAALVARYDEAQLQAVLLRATRITVEVACAAPEGYRALFRKLKFLRLLPAIAPLDGGGYRLVIDGPLSLFESVTRYGLQLALALPAITACDAWRLEADLRWGKRREELSFRLEGRGGTGLASDEGELPLAADVAALVESFRALGLPWRVAPAPAILDLPGVGLCVPDLAFDFTGGPAEGGERVWLEVLGFWSREAVWRRVELVERGLPHRILFAVSDRLRVGEAALSDELPGSLYVYKGAMSARAVAERIERLRARPAR